jgi:hypothetical protein
MKTHGWLGHVIMRTSGPVGGAHRKPSEGMARAWATRGILALALALGGLGVAMSASLGHGGGSHVHARTHQAASANSGSASSSSIHKLPWMY